MSHDFLDSSEQILNETKPSMKLKEAIEILKQHNDWRRDFSGTIEPVDLKALGKAIDTIVQYYGQSYINGQTHTPR